MATSAGTIGFGFFNLALKSTMFGSSAARAGSPSLPAFSCNLPDPEEAAPLGVFLRFDLKSISWGFGFDSNLAWLASSESGFFTFLRFALKSTSCFLTSSPSPALVCFSRRGLFGLWPFDLIDSASSHTNKDAGPLSDGGAAESKLCCF